MASTQSSADLRKAIEVTTRSFLAAYTDAYDHNDPSLINRDVTADCTRHMLPSTMVKALGLPADISIPNEAYIQNITQNIRVYSVRDSVISDLLIDTEARKASFTSKSNIVYKEGWESHPIEFSWYLDFTEDGSKVKKVTEFCDKDTVLLLHGRVMAGQLK
ncbi:hypothetical protein LY78DRAFT_749202 [Colletotrichum sublineola]|uniref:SnoaL-like domain-containing protein n=1 Tax=Colletotrichum sublineola TaxID=1173701 RepID=A0A066XFI5_COLSU|nr:hypothetical protein LY78DRAFT_749202 [Colletotrichum sublineola]KDN64765.1 putative conserved hypothetical protein [Colletotrichum sublineola]